jgi:RNA-binding protein
MQAPSLTGKQRRELLRISHALTPSVTIGKNGLTDAVVAALNEALEAHELIKLRFQGFKSDRRRIAGELATQTEAALVKVVGNVAVLYRPKPEPAERAIHV